MYYEIFLMMCAVCIALMTKNAGISSQRIERTKNVLFDLLSASAVIVGVHHKSTNRSVDIIHQSFATQKKVAKQADDYMNITTVL